MIPENENIRPEDDALNGEQVEPAQNINGEAPTEEAPKEESPYVALQLINIKIKPGFVLRKVGQAFMVMPTGPRMKEYQGMITLNETGAFLFKEAQKENPTKRKLMDACIAEYQATEEEALEAVDAFILQCAQCGLMGADIKVIDKRTGQEVPKDEFKK